MLRTFLILFSHKRKGSLSDQLLKNHVDYLKKVHSSGHLILCGPLADDTRAIWILKVQNEDQAKLLVEQDPFIKEVYYQSYEIHEFYLANPENNWLVDHPQTQENL